MSKVILVLLALMFSVPHGAPAMSLSAGAGDEMPFDPVLEDASDTLESLKVSCDLFTERHAVAVAGVVSVAAMTAMAPCENAETPFRRLHFSRPPPRSDCAG